MFNLQSTRFYSTMYFRAKTNCSRILEEKFGLAQSFTMRSIIKIWKVAKRIIFDNRYKVPRFYGFNEHKGDTVELHIFNDSLQLAYGTCAYFRIIQSNDKNFVHYRKITIKL